MSSFYENLVDQIDSSELRRIGNLTVELVTEDDEARSVWKSIVSECTTYLGLSKDRPYSGQNLPKETNLYGPSLRKAILMMSSKIQQSLFPAGSFVRSSTVGDTNAELEDRSQRIEDWFNHYLFNVLKGYKSDKEMLIFWYVICGCAFSKSYIDPLFNRPVAPYIHPDDLIISGSGTCLDDSERITHQFKITERDYLNHVNAGFYKLVTPQESIGDSRSIVEKAKRAYGIKEPQSTQKNKFYTFYECMIHLNIGGMEDSYLEPFTRQDVRNKKLPYLVTVDKESKQVLRLIRNYDEHDPLCNRKNHYTQYKLFPGYGPYGMGAAHLMLDLAKAETRAMNELMRAAELSNQPSLLMSSGSIRKEFTQVNMTPGSINRIDSITGNVRDAIQPLDVKEPSQTLFQLFQGFGQSIQELSAIRELTPDNVPAGAAATTMMGILSTMHIMEDAVINRLYDSFKNELQLFYDLFSEWLPAQPYPFLVPGGETSIMRQDFKKDVVIIPIVDPNVSSQTFQLIANDTLLQLMAGSPDLYNARSVHERCLRSMRISDIDEILKPIEEPAPPPPQLDPLSENQKNMKGEPIQVYKTQDHQSHITVHKDALTSLGSDDSKADAAAALQAHITDHESFAYANELEARMGVQLPEDPTSIPPDFQNQIAAKAAEATLQKQQDQAAANPPPPDPSEILLEELKVKQQTLELTRQSNEQKYQLDLQKAEFEKEQKIQAEALNQSKREAEIAKLAHEQSLDERDQALKEREQTLKEQEFAFKQNEAMQKMNLEENKTAQELGLEEEKALQKKEDDLLKANLEEIKIKQEAEAETLKQKLASAIESDKLQVEKDESFLMAESKAFDSMLKHETKTEGEPPLTTAEEKDND